MIQHLPILPVVVPLLAAIIVLALHRSGRNRIRIMSLLAIAINLFVAGALFLHARTGAVEVYALGSWLPPFGIALVADRLSSVMVLVTAVVAALSLLSASGGDDAKGRHFHGFFQLQIAGLNGAFLTGDLFNLFVFFEVLLIASYGLLVHGAGVERARAGLHYVILNLAGSTLFLFGLGLMYGITGTLNLADLGNRLPLVPEADQGLVRIAMIMLLTVFVLKAALAPLSFWLPRAYPAAVPAIGALFAVMTKVGVYAVIRLQTVALETTMFTSDILANWLLPLALLTIFLGTLGMFTSRRLATTVAHLVLISSGTLFAAIALDVDGLMSAVIFYLPHTIICTAAMFLIIGEIAARRGDVTSDTLERGVPVESSGWLALAFLITAMALTGLPPFSGFLGKWLLLASSPPASLSVYGFWLALILSGFAGTLVFARSGSRIFWEPDTDLPAVPLAERPLQVTATLTALVLVLGLTVGAGPLSRTAIATSNQIIDGAIYRNAVIPDLSLIDREVRR